MRETENNKRYKAAMQGVGMQNVKMQQEAADKGSLQVNVTSSVNSYPISEARISISYTGVPENTLEQLVTDSSGQTDMIELDAPPEEWSLDPENERQPYSEYTLNVSAPGFEPVSIAGTEILANTKAIQNIRMRPTDTGREEEEIFVIPAHTLYAEYPPKIAEDEIKPVNESGEIVLSRVVVPEYIVVHDGPVNDNTAQDYYVRYKDYIKNVIENAKALSDSLKSEGFRIVSDGTDNHLLMVDVKSSLDITGKEAETILDSINITCNKNMIPYDTLKPNVTSGIRLGSAAMTTRGLNKDDFKEIGKIISLALKNKDDENILNELKIRVKNITDKYPLYKDVI